MPFETKTINGLKVEHAPGSGHKILFVHGSGAGSWNWVNFLGQFSAAGYDCYAMNLRGHAPNPPLAELGQVVMKDYVDDVRGVLNVIGEDVILIGHSMGGGIAQMVAESAKLKALVMASSAPVAGVKFKNPPTNIWFILHIFRTIPAMVRKKPIPLGWRVMKTAVLNKIPEDQQQAMFAKFVPESGAVGMEVLKGTITADLARVNFPMLVISGTEDNTSLIEMEREIAAQHRADLIELPGHGHMFMMEPGWEKCGQKLLDWMKSKGL